MAESSIEWTEHTWNPVTGCTKLSPGCKHCYAETMARRLKAMGAAGYENEFELTLHPDRLDQPFRRKAPTVYFVNSMSDLFHEAVPDEFIEKVIKVCSANGCHQVLSRAIAKFSKESNRLGLSGPAIVKCALMHVDGYTLGVGGDWDGYVASADRPDILLPEAWVDAIENVTTDSQINTIVQPMMDVLWQAFDVERCHEFALDGSWQPR